MTYAMGPFIAEKIGKKYVEAIPVKLDDVYIEMKPQTPMLFILSPGETERSRIPW